MIRSAPPAILVLTGASGAGKSTLTNAYEPTCPPGVACFHADSIYHDLPEEILADGAAAQDALLAHFVNHAISHKEIQLAIIETQIRPHKALALLARMGIARSQVVLVECENDERNNRLRGPRAQPELVSQQMDCWAAYLRGQADSLNLEIINTSNGAQAGVAKLADLVDNLFKPDITKRARLIIVCGLPGAGKTTHAKTFQHAIRFCPDEWMESLQIDLWDAQTRERIEQLQWKLAQEHLIQRRDVVIEWGTWARSERDALRTTARELGASVELHFLDAPIDVLFQRLQTRKRESPPIQREDLEKWSAIIERPTREELDLFD